MRSVHIRTEEEKYISVTTLFGTFCNFFFFNLFLAPIRELFAIYWDLIKMSIVHLIGPHFPRAWTFFPHLFPPSFYCMLYLLLASVCKRLISFSEDTSIKSSTSPSLFCGEKVSGTWRSKTNSVCGCKPLLDWWKKVTLPLGRSWRALSLGARQLKKFKLW